MRYTLSRGEDPRSTLVVDTVGAVDDACIRELSRFMYENRCASGLLFDEKECVVLRDSFNEMSVASILEEVRIPTGALLSTLGAHNAGSLDVRVGRWLELLAHSWHAAIPLDNERAQELVYDVVPAASGATVHPWNAAA